MIYSSGFNTCCQPSDWDLTTGIININSTVSRQSVSFSMLKSVQDTWCLVCLIESKIFYSRDRHDITVIIWKCILILRGSLHFTLFGGATHCSSALPTN